MVFHNGSYRDNKKSKGSSLPKSARIERDRERQGSKRGGRPAAEAPKRVKMSIATDITGLTDKNRCIYLAMAFVYRYKEPERSE